MNKFTKFKLNQLIMRFHFKPKPKPYSERCISYFAFVPIKIGLEIRWLEKVVIHQFYETVSADFFHSRSYYKWKNHSFVNPPYRNPCKNKSSE